MGDGSGAECAGDKRSGLALPSREASLMWAFGDQIFRSPNLRNNNNETLRNQDNQRENIDRQINTS